MTAPGDYEGCLIPPEVYEIGLGWDPREEVDRLLFLAREHGVTPRSALELGCGAGRLLAALRDRIELRVGIELSEPMALRAAETSGAEVITGDMSRFDLARSFDLIYSSANTLRYLPDDPAVARCLQAIAAHLSPAGVYVADLEVGSPQDPDLPACTSRWMMSRGSTLVHVTWAVVRSTDPATRRCRIAWTFEVDDGASRRVYREEFSARVFSMGELAAFARDAGLRVVGVYEPRDPYLIPVAHDAVCGRVLCVFADEADVAAVGEETRSTE